MDWIAELEEKFGKDPEINSLKEKQFYGKLQINFFKGEIVDVNKYQTRKPTLK